MTEPIVGTLPMPSEGCPPPHSNPRRPSLDLPVGSWDAHCHVFGPASVFPYDPHRTFTPSEAPFESLSDIHRHLGFSRALVVQSACYGDDHSALFDCLRRSGGRYRGVALIRENISGDEIQRFHDAGIRGFRVHFQPHLQKSLNWDEVNKLARRVAALGWHAEVHVAHAGILEHVTEIADLPIPVVIDHLARVDLGTEYAERCIEALFRLVDGGHVWVKASGVDRISRTGPPYDDGVELAARLVHHAAERVLWGTDFPHTNIVGDAPDDGLLVDLLAQIATNDKVRETILVTNPSGLFGF